MPKALTDNERTFIKKRLMEEARSCIVQFGVRKTTVDELVKRVNIPKGTFYLFYKSKELLFFDVFCELHDVLKAELLNQIKAMNGNITPDTVTEMLFKLCKQVDDTFLYTFIASGDLELLVRKLPAEVAKAHTLKDDFSMENLLSMLPGVKAGDNIRTFSAVLRAVFCTMLHKREIGEDVFDDAIRIMLRGVVRQLFEGDIL
jgi:AcrR family transcriptional regulator